MTSTIDTEK
jgi:hypothetical protein